MSWYELIEVNASEDFDAALDAAGDRARSTSVDEDFVGLRNNILDAQLNHARQVGHLHLTPQHQTTITLSGHVSGEGIESKVAIEVTEAEEVVATG